MHESPQQSRPMRTMDWFIVTLIAGAVILPALLVSADAGPRQFVEGAAILLTAIGSVLLLSWMWFADGAHSCLWHWLPPFWPWSRFLTTTLSRQCLVAFLGSRDGSGRYC